MSLMEDMLEAAGLIGLLPAYVAQPEVRTSTQGLRLSWPDGYDAVLWSAGSWRAQSIDGTGPILSRAQMVQAIADRYRPVPRVIPGAVNASVFTGTAGEFMPNVTPGPGQVEAKLVEAVPE